MNPADIPNIEAMLQLWMLGMIRPGAAFIAAPVFGASSVPVQLRLVIALAVGFGTDAGWQVVCAHPK